ncbi:MAG: LURP-one-related family protein [Clostridia bacterium]|nr:LURP-one-related family protein [Clostridia bacterium]
MKLYIKQKVFSLNDKFTVKDEVENDLYFVESEFFTFGKKLHITNAHGDDLLSIEQKLFTFAPQYNIVKRGEIMATVVKRFSLFYPSYEIDGMPITVEGDFFDHTYDIFRDGRPIASIYKEWFTWGDSYVVDISNATDTDPLIILAIAITIDCVMASQNN